MEKENKNIKYIENFITILEKNINNLKKTKKLSLPFEELYGIIKDIKTLMLNDEQVNDSNYKVRGELCRKKLIPILNLILKLDSDKERNVDYYQILKYFYKIAARISLEHYFIYREWEDKDKYFAPRYNILQGYIHYLEEIENNPNFELLIVNFPSGYGKTYTEKISEAWSFGVDPTGAILSLCSNDTVVKAGSRVVMSEIKQPFFGEVFPNLKYDSNDKDFFLKETESDWKLRDCKLGSSYNAATTNSNVVGQRASKRIHIDDLYPNHKEAENRKLNQQYYDDYNTVWKKRFIQEAPTHKVVVTGTLWSSDDLIARLISYYTKRYKFKKHPIYPYTFVSENDKIAIIRVPALDYVTGESTCPQIRTTAQVMEDKDSIEEYLFQTNFQQIPTDPEALFFSYTRLKTYSKIPNECGKKTYAVIDATRKSGKDFFAMPIYSKLEQKNDLDLYYLKDCIFTREATNQMYNKIVDKIIQNHIVYLVIESNVTSELSEALRKILHKLKINWCEIVEKYNTIPKPTRIEAEKGTIKKQLIFPEKGMYGINTEMGAYMDNLTSYNNEGVNPNDDAPDSSAMFCSEIIDKQDDDEEELEVIDWIRELI